MDQPKRCSLEMIKMCIRDRSTPVFLSILHSVSSSWISLTKFGNFDARVAIDENFLLLTQLESRASKSFITVSAKGNLLKICWTHSIKNSKHRSFICSLVKFLFVSVFSKTLYSKAKYSSSRGLKWEGFRYWTSFKGVFLGNPPSCSSLILFSAFPQHYGKWCGFEGFLIASLDLRS